MYNKNLRKAGHKITPRLLVIAALAFPFMLSAQNGLADFLDELSFSVESLDPKSGILNLENIPRDNFHNMILIDTRESHEYEQSHIKGAKNIIWTDILNRLDEIPSDHDVLLYCNTGPLSGQAALLLRLAGYQNIKVLNGGIKAYQHDSEKLGGYPPIITAD